MSTSRSPPRRCGSPCWPTCTRGGPTTTSSRRSSRARTPKRPTSCCSRGISSAAMRSRTSDARSSSGCAGSAPRAASSLCSETTTPSRTETTPRGARRSPRCSRASATACSETRLWSCGATCGSQASTRCRRASATRSARSAPSPRGRGAWPLAHDWHALDEDVRFDLGVVGHTHGGQLCVPFTQVCAGPPRDRPYVRGRHPFRRGGVLYVNRGIGLSKLPFRVGCRPEITLFELGPRAP